MVDERSLSCGIKWRILHASERETSYGWTMAAQTETNPANEPAPKREADGRRARSARHRQAAVVALLELIRASAKGAVAGNVPTAEEVAIRAGLSRRTLFRLFEDIESLRLAALDHERAEVLARFPPPQPQPRKARSGRQSRRARIIELVRHRANVYEFIMPMRAIAEQLRHASAAVEQDLRESQEQFRTHLELMVQGAPLCVEARSLDALNAAELLTSWNAWRTLRIDQGASVEEARRAVQRGVLRILDIR